MIGHMPGMYALSPFQRSVRRGVLAAWRNDRKSRTLLLLAGVLTLLQLLTATLVGAQAVHGMLLARSALYLEVLPTADDQDIQELYAALRMLPFVRRVEFVPSEKAFERERERTPDLVAFLERYDVNNPFPDSFSVTLASLSDYDSFAAFISQETWADAVDPSFLSSVTGQERDVRQLLGVADAARVVIGLLAFVVCCVVAFVVAELVARKARHQWGDLRLESLLGGKPADALIPVAAEMATLLLAGLVAGSIVAGLLLLGASIVIPLLTGVAGLGELLQSLIALLLKLGVVILLAEAVLLLCVAVAATAWGLKPRALWPAPVRA
jgi:cell division protein FtsX